MSTDAQLCMGFVIGVLVTVVLNEIYDRVWGFRSKRAGCEVGKEARGK